MSTVPSPCRQICRLDAAGRLCLGCWRTLTEIAAWGSMSDSDRLATLQRCDARRAPEADDMGAAGHS